MGTTVSTNLERSWEESVCGKTVEAGSICRANASAEEPYENKREVSE